MNSIVIDELEDFREKVMNKISNRNIISFKPSNIHFDNNSVKVGDDYLSDQALSKILSTLRVKKDFIKYKDMLVESDWGYLEKVLKDANSDIEFWARRMSREDGVGEVVQLYKKNEALIVSDNDLTYSDYFDSLVNSLSLSDKEFKSLQLNFDDESENVLVRLINSDSIVELDDFHTSDDWKYGVDIEFDSLKYIGSPFFERQICTNGMVARKLSYKTEIKNKSFNVEYIRKNIEKLISNDILYESTIRANIDHMKRNDLSVKEFVDFKSIFDGMNVDGIYGDIIDRLFDMSNLYKTYGVNVEEKSLKWKSSANSGRNVYDFYNDVTYIGSHKDEFLLEDGDDRNLQISASNLFFKDTYDLEDFAPASLGKNAQVGKVFTINN